MLSTISNISSVATVILFIFYFLGRILNIKVEEKPSTERLVRCTFTNPHNPETCLILGDSFNGEVIDTISLRKNSHEGFILYSSVAMEKVEVFSIDYKEFPFKTNETLCCNYKTSIPTGYGLLFQVELSEGFPEYKIVVTRCDYRKTEILISENNKNGILDIGNKTKHTFLSLLYYITK